jgi:hypothetical protein
LPHPQKEAAMPRKFLAILPLIALAASARAYDPIVESRGWKQVAYAEDGDCEAEVRGNGQFYYIYAVGLGAGAPARYYLTNGDMKPIDWSVRADGNGEFARYYIPFRSDPYYAEAPRHSGTVEVRISTDQCSLALTFDWQRGIVEIEPDGTRHVVPSED